MHRVGRDAHCILALESLYPRILTPLRLWFHYFKQQGSDDVQKRSIKDQECSNTWLSVRNRVLGASNVALE